MFCNYEEVQISVVKGRFQISAYCHQKVMVAQGGLAFPVLGGGCLARAMGSSSVKIVVVNTGLSFREAVRLHNCGLHSGALRYKALVI